MPKETLTEWLVKGASLETGESVERRFPAESEGAARAMAKVAKIAVVSVEAMTAPPKPPPPNWRDNTDERILAESLEHRRRGQFPVVVKNYSDLVVVIASGIVLGNFAWWAILLFGIGALLGRDD